MASKTNCVVNGVAYYRKYATINGKRKMFYGKNMKDCQAKIDAAKIDEAIGLISTDDTVEEALETWLYNIYRKNPNIRISTFAINECTYRSKIKGSVISHLKVTEVKNAHVKKYIESMLGEGVTANTVRAAIKVLNMFFSYLLEEGYIVRNPCKKASVPKPPEPLPIKVYSNEEIKKIYDAMKFSRIRFLIILALSTGMRQGELLALKHSDLKGKKTVKVTKQQITQRHITLGEPIAYEIVDGPPKTKGSTREIPLPDFIQEEYAKHRRMCQEEKLRLGGGRLGESDYVFLSLMGMRCQTGQIQAEWKAIQEVAEVGYKSFHSLRHTYITKLVQSGVPIPTVMQLAGHSKMSTTLRYTHIEMGHKEEAISVIESLFDIETEIDDNSCDKSVISNSNVVDISIARKN